MRILSWPRAAGKSTASIEWLLESPDDRVVVTPDFIMARVLQDRIFNYLRTHPEVTPASWLTPRRWESTKSTQQLNLDAVRGSVVPWGDRQRLRGRQVTVFIDGLDYLLSSEIGQPVAYATVNDDSYLVERARRAGR